MEPSKENRLLTLQPRPEEKPRRFRLVKLEERRIRMDKLEERIAPLTSPITDGQCSVHCHRTMICTH